MERQAGDKPAALLANHHVAMARCDHDLAASDFDVLTSENRCAPCGHFHLLGENRNEAGWQMLGDQDGEIEVPGDLPQEFIERVDAPGRRPDRQHLGSLANRTGRYLRLRRRRLFVGREPLQRADLA